MSEATLFIEIGDRPRISEDWLAVAIAFGVFALALLSLAGVDALGWVVSTSVWTDPGAALAPVSKEFAGLSGGPGVLQWVSRCLSVFVLINHITPLA